MVGGSLVAVSYPVDGDFAQITTGVLDGDAEVAFLAGRPDGESRDILRRADVLIGWHLSEELPTGILRHSPRLRLVQLLSAGADSVAGASAGVSALIAAFAFMFPGQQVMLFFLIPVPVKFFFIFVMLMSTFGITTGRPAATTGPSFPSSAGARGPFRISGSRRTRARLVPTAAV